MCILFSRSECVAMANRALFPSSEWSFSALLTTLSALVYLICKEIKALDSTGIFLFKDFFFHLDLDSHPEAFDACIKPKWTF